MSSLLGLFIAYIYIFAVIGAAELLRRWRGFGSEFTRKFVHIGVGMLIWLVPFLFDSPWLFVFACLTFVVINLLDMRYGFFASMTTGDRSNLGTVYFPLAAAAAAIIFWDTPPLMVAALMPLTWGDGLAAVIGRRNGRHIYQIFGQTRSIEGSLTFIAAGGLFTWLALWLQPGPPEISASAAVLPALAVITLTALIEAVSAYGLDNLTVTAGAVLMLSLWNF